MKKNTLAEKLFGDSPKGKLFDFECDILRIEVFGNGKDISALVFVYEEVIEEKRTKKLSGIRLMKAKGGLSHE
jgi:hypothetical protein